MPHPRILKALGMTPAQWGELPPETVSPERNDLKRKAVEICKKEDEQSAQNGLNYRVGALESLMQTVSSDAGAAKSSVTALEHRVSALESNVSAFESRIAALESKQQTGG